MTTVAHRRNLAIGPMAYLPIMRGFDAISAMNTKSTGRIIPLMNCDLSMMSISPMSGNKTTIIEATIITVSNVLKVGASFHSKSTPASQPNASQTTNEVVRGNTHAAKNEAATRPIPNKIRA